jgi:hypothetical protein
MVTKVTARIGLLAALAALVVATPTSVGLAAPAAPAAPSAARATTVGDHCLVGTWRARQAVVPIEFHHKVVEMHYGGGDYLHIFANGTAVDHYDKSRVLEGFPNGFPLELHIRGTFTERLKGLEGTSAGKDNDLKILHESAGGWNAGSEVRATYNGKKVKFHFSGFRAHFDGYTCRNHGLFFIDSALQVHQTYDRRSFAP